jgi:hypothetical protein
MAAASHGLEIRKPSDGNNASAREEQWLASGRDHHQVERGAGRLTRRRIVADLSKNGATVASELTLSISRTNHATAELEV